VQGLDREREEQFAVIGQCDVIGRSIEQHMADLVFELSYLMRQRRLRHVHAFGGACEVQ